MFGWLKTIGKVTLGGASVVAPFLPFGGVATNVLKAVTGIHLIPKIGSKFPTLAPGEWAPIEAAVFGIGGRVVGIFGPGFIASFYFNNDKFRGGINQCIEVLVKSIGGLL